MARGRRPRRARSLWVHLALAGASEPGPTGRLGSQARESFLVLRGVEASLPCCGTVKCCLQAFSRDLRCATNKHTKSHEHTHSRTHGGATGTQKVSPGRGARPFRQGTPREPFEREGPCAGCGRSSRQPGAASAPTRHEACRAGSALAFGTRELVRNAGLLSPRREASHATQREGTHNRA